MYLTRSARSALARLEPGRRAAQSAAFLRVGEQLLDHGDQVQVVPTWQRGTWPGRRYPQQCYSRTLKYVRDHAQIGGIQLVHGVISHPERGAPLDHAWVELPGSIVFDAVVQRFFTRESYTRVMWAMRLDSYSPVETERLLAAHHHCGPWNARWVPTRTQVDNYFLAIESRADFRPAASLRYPS